MKKNILKKIWATLVVTIIATLAGMQTFAFSIQLNSNVAYTNMFVVIFAIIFLAIGAIVLSIYLSERKEKKKKDEEKRIWREEVERKNKTENK